MKSRITYLMSVLLVWCASSVASAQGEDPRVAHIANRILDKVPDIPHTERALGRGEARNARALAHARAIVSAADQHRTTWEGFRRRGNWEHFNVSSDLPALIAAITYRESAFQPVVRLDNGSRMYHSRQIINVRAMQQVGLADRGVMQVRAPSAPAHRCGVRSPDDAIRLVGDLNFGYAVGTCVLTNRLDRFVDQYNTAAMRRLGPNQRPSIELRFFGAWGTRRDTDEARRARELMVLERYNWGGGDFYMSPTAAGYARRVITEYEFFRRPTDSDDEG